MPSNRARTSSAPLTRPGICSPRSRFGLIAVEIRSPSEALESDGFPGSIKKTPEFLHQLANIRRQQRAANNSRAKMAEKAAAPRRFGGALRGRGWLLPSVSPARPAIASGTQRGGALSAGHGML